jgi:hypothetical protein
MPIADTSYLRESATLAADAKPTLESNHHFRIPIYGTALKISKELISQKLAGQELLARDVNRPSRRFQTGFQ